MKTFLLLSNKKPSLPKAFKSDDNRYPPSLVTYFLKRYTKKGDSILDPFAGLGTTLIAAEKLGRIPYGIEIEKRRTDFIATQLKHKNNIICSDIKKIDISKFPKFDFLMTSPPYMHKTERINALGGTGGYKGYLVDLEKIFRKLKLQMKKNTHLIIEVSNLKDKETTTLAWDIANKLSTIFTFEGEVVIGWTSKGACKGEGNYGYGYDHSYCLIFRNT